MSLIDFYGQFMQSAVACEKCKWEGRGREMNGGEVFGEGVEKHCPACDTKWGFVQFSVAVSSEAPGDWRENVGRVEF